MEDGVAIAHIGGENDDFMNGGEADRFSSFQELIHITSKDRDASALRSGLVGEGKADAAGSASDKHVAVLDWDLHGSRFED